MLEIKIIAAFDLWCLKFLPKSTDKNTEFALVVGHLESNSRSFDGNSFDDNVKDFSHISPFNEFKLDGSLPLHRRCRCRIQFHIFLRQVVSRS